MHTTQAESQETVTMDALNADDWSAILNGGVLLVAIATLGVAVEGLKLWKKELYGQDEYQSAKKMVRALLQMQSAVAMFQITAEENYHSDATAQLIFDVNNLFHEAKTEEYVREENSPHREKIETLDRVMLSMWGVAWAKAKEENSHELIAEAYALIEKLESEFRKKLRPPTSLMDI